jgi:hypothetical protein
MVEKKTFEPIFSAFKFSNFHCLLDYMCMGMFIPLKPHMFT